MFFGSIKPIPLELIVAPQKSYVGYEKHQNTRKLAHYGLFLRKKVCRGIKKTFLDGLVEQTIDFKKIWVA